MPLLEIRHRTGMIETRELSKEFPLLVGRQAANDIRVEADGVAPIHCRISWKKDHFEASAVAPEGVQWNGVTVRQTELVPDGVLRVGDVDIVLVSEFEEAPKKRGVATSGLPSASSLELKPTSTDALPLRALRLGEQLLQQPHSAAPAGPRGDPAPAGAPAPAADARPLAERRVEAILAPDEPVDGDVEGRPMLFRDGTAERAPKKSPLARLHESLKGAPKRPGEQEVLRSPLVIGLSAVALLLLLTAAALWFFLSREATQKQFDAAKAELDGGQYAQALESFQKFVQDHPRNSLVPEARISIGTARVEQHLAGTVPAYDQALKSLQEFVAEIRELKEFQDPESPLRRFARDSADRIAMESLESARRTRKRPMLAVSAEAVQLLELYSPGDARPTERLNQIAGKRREAEAAIVQQEAFDEFVQKVDAALEAKKPIAALAEYRRVLARYADAATYRPLKERVKKALDLERSLTARDEAVRDAIAEDRPVPLAQPPLTLARRLRTRTDVTSVGGTVFAVAENCVYGVDSMTGELLWRRVIGLDTPFSPIPVAAAVPALLAFDADHKELLLLALRTGQLVWRLPLEDIPRGAPLVHEGQIFAATESGRLMQIDLQSGRRSVQLAFSQPIVGPPVLAPSGERLLIPGHENVLYVLTRRPLDCESVSWLGQAPGAISAPGLIMRNYLLLAFNDQLDKCTLRVFDVSRDDQPLVEITGGSTDKKIEVEGQVRDAPVLRGKQLIVTSSAERVTAFTVAETGDSRVLTPVGSYRSKSPTRASVYVSIGPDNQLWSVGSAVRRLEIGNDSLVPDKEELAVGIASQPLQVSGDSLFVGRRLPYSRAVVFVEADRQRMAVEWQAALGAAVLEMSVPSAPDGAFTCVTSLGDLFQITAQKLARGGFEQQALGQVPIPEGLSESLSAVRLTDGRVAVYCGGGEPRLWLVGSDGGSREYKLAQPLQAGPVQLAGGLLLPVEGRLRLIGRPTDSALVEDLPVPTSAEETPRWRSAQAVSDTEALVLNDRGRIARIQYRDAPVAHLAEITPWDAGAPVDLPLSLADNRAFVVDARGRLTALDARSLEPLAETSFDAPASRAPIPMGNLVVVEVDGTKLVCCDAARRLAVQWELPLDAARLAGAPVALDGRLVCALQDGRILVVDAASGRVEQTRDLGQRLAFGPRLWGDAAIVGTLDGSLISFRPLAAGSQ